MQFCFLTGYVKGKTLKKKILIPKGKKDTSGRNTFFPDLITLIFEKIVHLYLL